MKKKALTLLLIIMLILPLFSGCWDRNELNQLGFSTALGFDQTKDGQFIVTAQVLNPRATVTQQVANESSVVVFTEQGDSVLKILRRMSTESPRRIVGTHMQTIVFGENFAKEGIAEVIDFLLRHYQTSSELFFTVAKGSTANQILNNLTKLESNPSAKINSTIVISQKIWGETNEIKLTELTNCMIDTGLNAVITGVQMKRESPDNSLDDLKLTPEDPIELSGNAIFEGEKLVGWMDEKESQGFNYIYGNLAVSALEIEDEETGKVTMNIKKVSSQQNVTIADGAPQMKVKMRIECSIQNMSGNLDISQQKNLDKIQTLSEEKLKETCMAAIKKAKAVKSDIFGFGDTLHRTDPQLWKAVKNSWNTTGFINLPIELEIEMKIISTDSISQFVLYPKE